MLLALGNGRSSWTGPGIVGIHRLMELDIAGRKIMHQKDNVDSINLKTRANLLFVFNFSIRYIPL